jgi:hypothetical protein
LNKMTEEDRARAVCSVSRAGMGLLTLCEEIKDPVLSSKLNRVLDDVRVATQTLYGKRAFDE